MDPVSLLGLIVSSTGLVYSAWSGVRSGRDLATVQAKLKDLSATKLQSGEDQDVILRQLEAAGLLIRQNSALPRSLLPIEGWADRLARKPTSTADWAFLLSPDKEHIKRWEISRQHLEKLVEPSDSHPLHLPQPTSDLRSNDPLFHAALRLIEQGRYQLAVQLLLPLTQNEGTPNWQIWNNIGVCYQRLGFYEKALESLSRSQPPSRAAHSTIAFNTAVVLYNLSRFQEAHNLFRQALSNDNLATEALAGMIDSALRLDL